ncbi:hypothetical protein CDAR_14961 [Caerostris darwini]|uniref:Uncharacterized protein n=1 Tax=Caerostris darwini TaxID=1538125 RepID=A0AAV4W9T4_9ARAC|nr:hypothetical protein CDAR_14961 [Caerostris darwini]
MTRLRTAVINTRTRDNARGKGLFIFAFVDGPERLYLLREGSHLGCHHACYLIDESWCPLCLVRLTSHWNFVPSYTTPVFIIKGEGLLNGGVFLPRRFLHREGGSDSTWLSTCSGYPPEEVSSDFRSASQIAASGKKVEGRKKKKKRELKEKL